MIRAVFVRLFEALRRVVLYDFIEIEIEVAEIIVVGNTIERFVHIDLDERVLIVRLRVLRA